MYKYNDYLKLTKDYLKNFAYYRQAINSISEDIEDIRKQLATESIKAPAYGSDTSGGFNELNGIERAAENRIRLTKVSEELQENCRVLERQMKKVTAAINTLPEDERQAVQMYYMDRMTYGVISEKLHLSERSCKRRISKATRSIAFMLFGLTANRNVFFVTVG